MTSHTGSSPEALAFPPRIGGLSDVGRVREFNEDNLRWEPLSDELVLVAVADGMGGHDRGEVASELAVSTLFEEARRQLERGSPADDEELSQLLYKAFRSANYKVVETGRENDSNMGTTLCAALISQSGHAVVANVGDSRVYCIEGEELRQVSRDHSLVAYLVQMGELTPAQARNHPSGNILVRSVGSVPEVEVDLFSVHLVPGSSLLLCSDGLWGEVLDEDILRISVAHSEPQDVCEHLVQEANMHGGRDNTTVLLASV